MTAPAVAPPRRRWTLSHLALLLPWIGIVIDAWTPIRDNSFLWHVRAGSIQLETGRVLTEDPFSFTMVGEPWLTQSWLAELFYAWAERVSGLAFVPPMLLALNIITFLGIGLVAYRRSENVPATALVLLLSTVLLLSFLVPRPVIFSFALFAMVLVAWDRPGMRWAVPFLFWIWASVHGSFVIGLAYLGLSVLAEKEWRALPTALLSGAVTLLTAHGLGVVTILIEFSQAGSALALLSEWRRPEFLSVIFTPLVVGVVLIVIGAARRKIEPRHLWLVVPFLALSLAAVRAVPPAWLALVPLVGLSLHGLGTGRRIFSAQTGAIFALVVLVIPFVVADGGTLDHERFPVAAAGVLEDVPTFHDDRTGGYLIFAYGPEFQVYLDDRAELYGDRLAEFVAVRDGETDWRPVFERDGIEQVLLGSDQALVEELSAAGWETVHEDGSFVVLIVGRA